MNRPTITQTTLSMFLECPSKYRYNQVDGLFPKKLAAALGLGTVLHKAMEIATKQTKDLALEYIRSHYMEQFRGGEMDDATFDLLKLEEAVVKGMVENYPWFSIPVAYPERIFQVRDYTRFPFNLACKIDGMRSHNDGFNMLIDYKTKSRMDHADNDHILARNLQANFYLFLMDLMEDIPCDGMEFIYLRKSQLRRRQHESIDCFASRIYEDYGKRPEWYYIKQQIYKAYDERWVADLGHWLHTIELCYDTGQWPRNETSCNRWGSPCPWIYACNNVAGWEDFYENRGADHHPELIELDDIESEEETNGSNDT